MNLVRSGSSSTSKPTQLAKEKDGQLLTLACFQIVHTMLGTTKATVTTMAFLIRGWPARAQATP